MTRICVAGLTLMSFMLHYWLYCLGLIKTKVPQVPIFDEKFYINIYWYLYVYKTYNLLGIVTSTIHYEGIVLCIWTAVLVYMLVLEESQYWIFYHAFWVGLVIILIDIHVLIYIARLNASSTKWDIKNTQLNK